MDNFNLIAIMLFSIQFGMEDDSIVDVINAIDINRGDLSRTDYLACVVTDAIRDHDIYNVSYGIYDKYLDDERFVQGVLPF